MKKKLVLFLFAVLMCTLFIVSCTDVHEDSTDSQSASSVESTDSVHKAPEDYTYEEYIAMSGKEQEQYFFQFEDVSDFFDWFNSAKAEYEANREYIEIGEDGVVDLGEIFGNDGNN